MARRKCEKQVKRFDYLFCLTWWIFHKEEIKQLVARAFANKENRDSWRLNSFYENVIESCLSGVGNQRLIKELPKLIVETAWKYWKYIPPKEDRFPKRN